MKKSFLLENAKQLDRIQSSKEEDVDVFVLNSEVIEHIDLPLFNYPFQMSLFKENNEYLETIKIYDHLAFSEVLIAIDHKIQLIIKTSSNKV
ncbi:hypothetical protein [Mesonia sp.]|uniref:hypothetical protein n=1 Tax=Mesonia sp. TaxID=1960830 RepID=UPI00175D06E4|nr:hypothetical protein [Mesonia sp.]HIB38212.1 hypothetical protein [Mesonia sp.]HIO28137.1 hypothetical protein [Flavobacteriaceae bacterium]